MQARQHGNLGRDGVHRDQRSRCSTTSIPKSKRRRLTMTPRHKITVANREGPVSSKGRAALRICRYPSSSSSRHRATCCASTTGVFREVAMDRAQERRPIGRLRGTDRLELKAGAGVARHDACWCGPQSVLAWPADIVLSIRDVKHPRTRNLPGVPPLRCSSRSGGQLPKDGKLMRHLPARKKRRSHRCWSTASYNRHAHNPHRRLKCCWSRKAQVAVLRASVDASSPENWIARAVGIAASTCSSPRRAVKPAWTCWSFRPSCSCASVLQRVFASAGRARRHWRHRSESSRSA